MQFNVYTIICVKYKRVIKLENDISESELKIRKIFSVMY